MTSGYLSGAEVLSEARLRRASLGPTDGVLIVEGRDDFRLINRVCRSSAHVLPAGEKEKVLDAAARLRPNEDREFVLLVDCDYDVPAGELQGKPHLIITKCPDAECDMVALGIFEQVVLQTVPAAAGSHSRLKEITEIVLDRSVALAGAVGQLRQLSRVENLGLDFDGLRFARTREKKTAIVNRERLTEMVLRRSGSQMSVEGVHERAGGIAAGLMTCNGHDLVESLRAVLKEDFGVRGATATGLEQLLRVAAGDPQFLESWSVIERIRTWETETGKAVLA